VLLSSAGAPGIGTTRPCGGGWVSLLATKRRESTERRSRGCGDRRICSPLADVVAAHAQAGPRPGIDSVALFVRGDTGDVAVVGAAAELPRRELDRDELVPDLARDRDPL